MKKSITDLLNKLDTIESLFYPRILSSNNNTAMEKTF
jgi:hypothetical protein